MPDRPPERDPEILGRVTAVVAIWAFYLAVFPLEPIPPGEVVSRLLLGWGDLSVDRPLVHGIALGALGALVGLRAAAVSRRRGGFALLVFVLAIEALQGFAPARHPRVGDLLLDLAAAGAGFAAARAVARRFAVSARLAARDPLLARLAAVATAGLVLAASAFHERDLTFAGWDPTHRLAVGNELTGDRPWRGDLHGVAVYPRALEAEEIAELAGRPFDAAGREARRALGAAWVHGPTGARVMADAVARGLHDALVATSALSVELVARSADADQTGPARLVTLSRDPGLRNFTVGQEGDALVLRLRTPATGPNGTDTQAQWPGVFAEPGAHHLAVTYHRGRARAFLDGEARPGVWPLDRASPRFAHVPVARPLWTALLLFLPLAAFAELGWRERPAALRRVCEGVAGGALVAVGTALASARYDDPTWDPGLVGLAALCVPLFDFGLGALRAVSSPEAVRISRDSSSSHARTSGGTCSPDDPV